MQPENGRRDLWHFYLPYRTPSQDNTDLEAHIPSVEFWSLIPEREEQTLLENYSYLSGCYLKDWHQVLVHFD